MTARAERLHEYLGKVQIIKVVLGFAGFVPKVRA